MALLKIHEPLTPAIQQLSRPGGKAVNPPRGLPLLRLGFRPFYLVAAALAALAIPLWVAAFFGAAPFGLQPTLHWHVHEMVYGFAVAVIVGFLYTAVRNWTNSPTPRGTHLAVLVLLWCAGRVAMLTAPPLAGALVDIAFLPAAAWPIWQLLRKTRNRRNQFLPLILGALALLNALFHAASLGWLALDPLTPLRGGLLLIVLIELVMGGRVIPSFTSNAVPQARPKVRPREDRLAIALALLAIGSWLLGLPAPAQAGSFAAAALVTGRRVLGYQPQHTLAHPLLWILHFAYLWIAIGFALLSAAALDLAPASAGWHALGVGATGGLVIGMITRTALGHTGRALQAGRADVLMYALLMGGALLRVLASLHWGDNFRALLLASAGCWSVAFAVYLAIYVPRLSATRVDGNDG
jgi:uncharacterized protein involved in response to NO